MKLLQSDPDHTPFSRFTLLKTLSVTLPMLLTWYWHQLILHNFQTALSTGGKYILSTWYSVSLTLHNLWTEYSGHSSLLSGSARDIIETKLHLLYSNIIWKIYNILIPLSDSLQFSLWWYWLEHFLYCELTFTTYWQYPKLYPHHSHMQTYNLL